METITIEQKNEEIAKMLGWLNKHPHMEQNYIIIPYGDKYKQIGQTLDRFRTLGKGYQLHAESAKFHSDWNWLMEAVRFINSTHKHNIETRDLTYTLQGLSAGGYWNNSDVRENSINFNSIDDAFDAVYRFAKTWNKKNEN